MQRSRKLRPQHVPEDGSFTIGRFVGEVLAVLLDVGRLDLLIDLRTSKAMSFAYIMAAKWRGNPSIDLKDTGEF